MRSVIVTIVCVAVLVLLVLTNPRMADYQDFVHADIIRKTEQADPVSRTLGMLFGGIGSGLVANATKRTDYVFFSLYETRLNGDYVEYLGVFKNFFVLTDSSAGTGERRGR